MNKPKTIPTILGLFLLLVTTVFGVFLTQKPFSLTSQAGSSCQPKNVQVSNLTNSSVNISFLTDKECSSAISLDNRTFSQPEATKAHYFFAHQLQAETEYDFSIISNGQTITSPEYKFTTATQPDGAFPTSNLAWGMVFDSDHNPAQNALVFLSIPGGSLLSAQTTSQGLYSISLATSFNYQLNSWFSPPKNTAEEIIAISSTGIITQISGNTSNNNPVPDIIIGQDQLDNSSTSSNQTGQLEPGSLTASDFELDVFNPGEGESISTQKPEFFGSGPKGEIINIQIESDPVYSDQVTVDPDGSWNWTPPSDLAPGDHTLTLKSRDKTIIRHFTVLAADDSSTAFTASSSASQATPTSTPRPSPIPTSTLAPTATPTLVPATAGTATPTIPIRTQKPATDSAVPVTATSWPTLVFVVISMSSFVGYFFIKKNSHY